MDRPDAVAAYERLVERAREDPAVAGVVAFGSRAVGAEVTVSSDVDCFVIVDGPPDAWRAWQTPHGSPVEVWATTLDSFRGHGLHGSSTWWNRPSLIRARVDLDKLDGEIGRIVDGKRRLSEEEAGAVAADALDDAINALYRALGSAEAGRDLGARLDAGEAIGPLLGFAFAIEGRVRPFNKWLVHELEREPLVTPAFADLAAEVARLAAEPTAARIRATFRMLEAGARESGHGDVVDGWQPDVAWLRGEAAYRA